MQTGQNIVVNAGGSGSGFNQLAEGQTDIGMMSRDITNDELSRFEQYIFTPIAIGRDAVVPVVSSEVYDAGVTQLSFGQIKDIYMGRIDNWNAVGGPDKEIFVIDKESSSGTRQTSYPISRDLNIIVRDDISPDAQAFVDYILSPKGQVFVRDSGYVSVNE